MAAVLRPPMTSGGVCACVAAVLVLLQLADITGLLAEECGPDVHMAYRILTAPAPSGPLSVTVIATHAGPSSMPAEPAAMPVGFRQQ